MQRAEDLKRLLAANRTRGGGDYLLTLTTPHDMGDRLKPMRQAVANAWRYVNSGAPAQRLRIRLGLGWVRGAEVTIGPAGWHPHLHVLLLTDKPLADCPNCRHTAECREGCGHHPGAACAAGCQVGELARFVLERWRISLERAGYRAPSAEHGIDVRACRVARYLAKLGLGDELAKASFKTAATGHRTPLQLLFDVAVARQEERNDDAARRDLALWAEYSRGMRGARQLTSSAGLWERYGVAETPEQLLLEIQEPEQAGLCLWTIEPEIWRRFVSWNVSLQLRLLRLAEELPPDDARDAICKELERVQGYEVAPF